MSESVSKVYSDLYPVVYDLTDYIPSIDALRRQYVERILQFDIGGKILEVGAGTGAIMRRLIEKGVKPHRLVGIDNSDSMIKIAKEHNSELKILRLDPLNTQVDLSNIEELVGTELIYTANFLYQIGVSDKLPSFFSKAMELLPSGGGLLIMEPSNEYSVLRDTALESLLSLPNYRHGFRGLIKLATNLSSLRKMLEIQPMIIPDRLPTIEEYIMEAEKVGFVHLWHEKAPDGSVISFFQKHSVS